MPDASNATIFGTIAISSDDSKVDLSRSTEHVKALHKETAKAIDVFRELEAGTRGLHSLIDSFAVGPLKTVNDAMFAGVRQVSDIKKAYDEFSSAAKNLGMLNNVSTGLANASESVGNLSGQLAIAATGADAAAVAINGTSVATAGLASTTLTALAPLWPVLIAIGAILGIIAALLFVFKIAWEANFLGIRDIVDSVVGNVLDILSILYEMFISMFEDVNKALREAGYSGGDVANSIDMIAKSVIELLIVFAPLIKAVMLFVALISIITASGILGGLTGGTLPAAIALITIAFISLNTIMKESQQIVAPLANLFNALIELFNIVISSKIVDFFKSMQPVLQPILNILNAIVNAMRQISELTNKEIRAVTTQVVSITPAAYAASNNQHSNVKNMNATANFYGAQFDTRRGKDFAEDFNDELIRGFDNV